MDEQAVRELFFERLEHLSAEPFDPPEWRARWVEPMEQRGT